MSVRVGGWAGACGVRAAAASGVAALVLAASGTVGASATQLDARFVDSVRADGHDLPDGSPAAAALVAAARKICERRSAATRRRDSALTRQELDEVARTFADPQRFATLALDTYCP